LGLALALATNAPINRPVITSTELFVADTQGTSFASEITEHLADRALLAELERIHNYLINERADLDDVAYRALYRDLWDLYE
jgi:hypothetical protein